MTIDVDTLVLYDDRIEIGFEQLEKIVQALVWLGDAVVLPSLIRPDPRLRHEDAETIKRRLGEFAEAGYIDLWDLDGPDASFLPPWMPGAVETLVIPEDVHRGLARIVDEATRKYRQDILRGIGKPEGVALDGITEFVTLRSAVWAHCVADTVGADHLLQLPQRSPSVPLKKVATVKRAVPITETLMDLHRITSLGHLGPTEVDRLRARMPGARSFVMEIVDRSPSDVVYRDEADLIADLKKEAQAAYVDVVTPRSDAAFRNIAVGWTVNLLGLVHPLLTALGFAHPVVDWRLRERRNRQIVTFMAQLKKLAADTAPVGH